MPVTSVHPLPANPTTGQQPSASFAARSISTSMAASSISVPLASAAGGGGVNREVLKGLQDVAWSDDEVSAVASLNMVTRNGRVGPQYLKKHLAESLSPVRT
jgi:hypothetical protein